MRRAGFPKVTAERRERFLASTLELTPAPQGHSSLRRRLTQPLWVLLAATGILLGLACLNVAGLFLARGSARDREISTRLALGASRGRIGRQLLADSVLLALAGGLLGLALAPAAMRALIAFLPQDTATTALRSSVDARLLLFAFARERRGRRAQRLRAGPARRPQLADRLAPRARRHRWRRPAAQGDRRGADRVLAGARDGAVLFVQTLTGLLAKGPGFDTSSLVSFGVDPRRSGYSPADASRLTRRIHDEIRASAGAPRRRPPRVSRC